MTTTTQPGATQLPAGAATAAHQVVGDQKAQIVDAAGNALPAGDIAARAIKTDASATTQPVSAAALPLPAGAATAALQPALNGDGGALTHVVNFPATQPVSGSIGASQVGSWTTGRTWSLGFTADRVDASGSAVSVSNFPATQPVSAAALPLPAGAATAALQPALNVDGGALAHVVNFPATQPVSATALPLPAGAATSAAQTDGSQKAQVTAIADGVDATQGAKADAAATDSTSAWSVVSVLKGIWNKLAGLIQTNVNQGALPVSSSNPLWVQGTVAASGATLNIVVGLSASAVSLNGVAYSGTSAISGPYKLNCIKFHFTTAAPRTISVTDATTGTLIAAPASTTATDYLVPCGGIGFPSGHQFTVSVTATSAACAMTFSAEIENGQLPMGGSPTILFDPSLKYNNINGVLASNGATICTDRINQVECQWDGPLANNDATATATGSGVSATQGNGQMTLSCGAGVTGQSDVVTNKKVLYSATAPLWAEMTAQVSAVPTSVNTQVWFIYWGDDTNYIRFGLVGGNLVVQAGRGGTQFINDIVSAVDGATGNLLTQFPGFTRSGGIEYIDVTKSNLYYLEWRYLGIGPIVIRITPPDGGPQVVLYLNQRPNSDTLPTTFAPSQPIRQRIVKASADAQVISMASGSWGAGTMEPPAFFQQFEVKSRKLVNVAVANQTSLGQSIYTVSPGRQLLMQTITLSATGGSQNEVLQVFDGNGGALMAAFSYSGGSNANAQLPMSFPTPLRFVTGIYVTSSDVALHYSIVASGYEKRL